MSVAWWSGLSFLKHVRFCYTETVFLSPCMEHWSKFWNADLSDRNTWKNPNKGHCATSSHGLVSLRSSPSSKSLLALVTLVAPGRFIRLKGSRAENRPAPDPLLCRCWKPAANSWRRDHPSREDGSFKFLKNCTQNVARHFSWLLSYSLLVHHLPMCGCFCIVDKESELNTTFNS